MDPFADLLHKDVDMRVALVTYAVFEGVLHKHDEEQRRHLTLHLRLHINSQVDAGSKTKAHQGDVVGKKLDYAPYEAQEKSELVFISKIGIALIREIKEAWDECVGLPMDLKN